MTSAKFSAANKECVVFSQEGFVNGLSRRSFVLTYRTKTKASTGRSTVTTNDIDHHPRLRAGCFFIYIQIIGAIVIANDWDRREDEAHAGPRRGNGGAGAPWYHPRINQGCSCRRVRVCASICVTEIQPASSLEATNERTTAAPP